MLETQATDCQVTFSSVFDSSIFTTRVHDLTTCVGEFFVPVFLTYFVLLGIPKRGSHRQKINFKKRTKILVSVSFCPHAVDK
jgi:hypothetical protein